MGFSLWWSALGTLIVLFAIFDFYTTTVTVSGSGPMSKWLARRVWVGFLAIHRRKPNHRLLAAAGPCIVLVLILGWFFFCWLGWFLIFCGSESSVISAKTTLNASIVERIYFSGYTLMTIGYGDFRPPNTPGQIISVLCGLNGLFLVTLAITYSIPVVSSSVDKRRLSTLIHSIGHNSKEIVEKSIGSGDFQFLVSQLQQITSDVASISEKHLAYPILLYFHAPSRDAAMPLTLSRLDEALSLVAFAFPDTPQQTRSQIAMSQEVIANFLGILHANFISEADHIPAPPDFMQIDSLKQSPMTRDEIQEHLATLERRRQLLAFVEADGWRWTDVNETDHDESKRKL
ncbi:two pore domain potassium channel family protein [Proteobacteria bacterium 005FR1]|nr:two pore domain potassium channel family protein [Proteobacteria bacterium 005FR1]